MKRTQRTGEPLAAKAPKTVASSSDPVPNPLKDKAFIRAAAIAAARELVAGCAEFTGAQFSRRVMEKMGYGREFAVNDQGTRTRLHSKDVKLAAFEAVGAGFDGVGVKGCNSWALAWLKAHESEAFPINFPTTSFAWDCMQEYLIDPTGWSVQTDIRYSSGLPGCGYAAAEKTKKNLR